MKFCIQHVKTKLFFVGYIGNKPCWTGELKEALKYSEKEAIQLKQRLACQSQETLHCPIMG